MPAERAGASAGGAAAWRLRGGLPDHDARELARRRFTALALAHFGMPGLPPGLIDVPLEYFARGLDVLAEQPSAGQRFGVTGGSRGGEAALLVGARQPHRCGREHCGKRHRHPGHRLPARQSPGHPQSADEFVDMAGVRNCRTCRM